MILYKYICVKGEEAMKKWEDPELLILGVENTKTAGKDDDDDCDYCDDEFNPDHDHGEMPDECPCCGNLNGVLPPFEPPVGTAS